MAARAGRKPHLANKINCEGPPCQTSHTHIFAQGRIISQGRGVGGDAPSKATRGYPRSLQDPTFGSTKRAKGASPLGSSTLDSSLGLIYDPRGETKFPCPPQTAQTNETDALFIIAGAKPGAKAEVRGEKKKKTQKTQKAKGEEISFPPRCYSAHRPRRSLQA